jgi:large subunit ribosomal protein L21
MYAVIETGGKQYRVEIGTVLEVEKLDAEAGATITLDRVLLVADGDEASIGRPVVDGAAVSAEVLRQDRADKVIVFKYRPKARRRVKKGHRQDITVLRVSDIMVGGRSAAATAAKAEEDAKTERERLEEAAAKQAAADAALAAKLAERASKTSAAADAEAKPKTPRRRKKAAPAAEPEAPAAEAGGETAEAEAPAAEAEAPAAEAVAEPQAEAEPGEQAAPPETADTATEAPTKTTPKRRTRKKDE